MEKLVSVIIPSYNDGPYLKKAIDSILNQTYPNIEIIVVDSSDDKDTIAILESYKGKIRCFHQPPKGVATALNYGLERAGGEFIARMDADDISLPQRISIQVEFLEKNLDIDILGTQSNIINEEGDVVESSDVGYYSDSQIKAKIIFENCKIHPTVMMRAQLVKKGWRYDEKQYAEDLRLWMQMATQGLKFANLHEHLLLYRKHANSMSSDRGRVALSVNRSARQYVEELFGIPKNKYEDEDFARPYYSLLLKKGKADFIANQLSLLRDIFEANEQRKVIERSVLIRELNQRWKWVFENYGESITEFLRKDFFCPSVADDQFFLNEISTCFIKMDTDNIIAFISDVLQINDIFFEKQKQDPKNIVVYGVGQKGKELLSILEQKILDCELSWKLIALADVKKVEVIFMGEKYETISPEALVQLNPSIVIISSNKYYNEIYNELKEKGLKSKIVRGTYII